VSVTAIDEQPTTTVDEREALAIRLAEEMEAESTQQRRRRVIQGPGGRQETSAWLRFTGWHVHLAGFDRGEILLTIRPAAGDAAEDGLADLTIEEDREAPGLAAACRSTRRLIRRAFQTARPEIVGRPALEAVNRRETGVSSNERPFYAEQKV
jgi:hypothetical protein